MVWTREGAESPHSPQCPDTTQKQHCPATDWSLKRRIQQGIHLFRYFCFNFTELCHKQNRAGWIASVNTVLG